jgi:hypothetical protein
LDQVGGGSAGPTVGQGRGKDQCSDPRAQAEAEDNTNPRMSQRDAGDEEAAGRTHHCANAETRASGSNGAITGAGSRSTGTGRGS